MGEDWKDESEGEERIVSNISYLLFKVLATYYAETENKATLLSRSTILQKETIRKLLSFKAKNSKERRRRDGHSY